MIAWDEKCDDRKFKKKGKVKDRKCFKFSFTCKMKKWNDKKDNLIIFIGIKYKNYSWDFDKWQFNTKI